MDYNNAKDVWKKTCPIGKEKTMCNKEWEFGHSEIWDVDPKTECLKQVPQYKETEPSRQNL